MRDYYALLQKSTASTMQTILHMPVSAQHVEIPAAGYAARSAAPLEFHAQAWDWAAQLNENAALFQLFGAPYVAGVGANNGHLLFTFTGAFYTAALQEILKELPPAHVPVPYSGEDAALQRIAYAARRMWMLRRKAQGTPCCPAVEEVQRALLLAMAISGGGYYAACAGIKDAGGGRGVAWHGAWR